ncbi:hypothetical protein, partial [Paracoccus sp. (in: a-proteobacteria)]|uniref:hypothetical protein n=1 Tax=Paracoccus sp. TaxID=267 RepID=UPI003A8BFABD
AGVSARQVAAFDGTAMIICGDEGAARVVLPDAYGPPRPAENCCDCPCCLTSPALTPVAAQVVVPGGAICWQASWPAPGAHPPLRQLRPWSRGPPARMGGNVAACGILSADSRHVTS